MRATIPANKADPERAMTEAPDVEDGKLDCTVAPVFVAPVPEPDAVPLPEAEAKAVALVARLAFWT